MLVALVNSLGIEENKKSAIISDIPKMNEQERVRLVEMLGEVYVVDSEKKQAIEKIKNSWENSN